MFDSTYEGETGIQNNMNSITEHLTEHCRFGSNISTCQPGSGTHTALHVQCLPAANQHTTAWQRGSVVRNSVFGWHPDLCLIYSWHATTLWVKCPLCVNQSGQFSLPSLSGRKMITCITRVKTWAACRGLAAVRSKSRWRKAKLTAHRLHARSVTYNTAAAAVATCSAI